MNFEALAAELLAQPVDQFAARRNARVKELKASGQADLANRLAALKKPSLPLWAANQVAAHNRARLSELREAAQALIKAQASAGAGRANAARELRAASEEFQRRLEAAGQAAAATLRNGGHGADEEALRRIREILRLAALQGGDTWRQLEAGALTAEPRPGEDMLEVFGIPLPPAGRAGEGVTKRAEARRAEQLAQKAAKVDAERAQRAAATARRLREEATEASAAAEKAAERAKAAEDEAARAQAQAEKSQRAGRRGRA